MREAPAFAGQTGSRARSNGVRKRKPSAPRSGRAASLVSRAFARPGVTIAGAAFAAVMTVIVANAILFQKGHHPSPLFGASHTAKAPASVPPPVQATVAVPPPAASAAPVTASPPAASSPVSTRAEPVAPPAPLQLSRPSPAVKAKQGNVQAARRTHADPIGQLIDSHSGGAASTNPPKNRSVTNVKAGRDNAGPPVGPHT